MRDTKRNRNPETDRIVEILPTVGEHFLAVTSIANLPAPGWAEGQDRARVFAKLLDGSTFEETTSSPPSTTIWGTPITAPLFFLVPEARLLQKLIDQVVQAGRATVYQIPYYASLRERLEEAITRPSAVAPEAPSEPGAIN